MTNVQAVLEPYRIYSPCHFSMIDGQDHCLTANDACVSDDFTISDTTDPERQVWSLKIWLSSSLSRLRPEAVVFMQASEKLSFGYLGQCYCVWFCWHIELAYVGFGSPCNAYATYSRMSVSRSSRRPIKKHNLVLALSEQLDNAILRTPLTLWVIMEY